MADIVITEFLDQNSLRDLKKTHDVHYGPDLVDAISAEGRSAIWPGGPDVALVDEPA